MENSLKFLIEIVKQKLICNRKFSLKIIEISLNSLVLICVHATPTYTETAASAFIVITASLLIISAAFLLLFHVLDKDENILLKITFIVSRLIDRRCRIG